MTVVKMERVSITLPPDLLVRIDEDRGRAGGKRSSFIVKVLQAYYRRKDREEKEELKRDLLEALRAPEFKELIREAIDQREVRQAGGPGEGEGRDLLVHAAGPGVRVRKSRGDSIDITEEMRALMRSYQNNLERPTRRELRVDYGIDTGDLPRWISGEKTRMRIQTWERLEPILRKFAL